MRSMQYRNRDRLKKFHALIGVRKPLCFAFRLQLPSPNRIIRVIIGVSITGNNIGVKGD